MGGVCETGVEDAGSGRNRRNYVTLRNISQSKTCKEVGVHEKKRAGTGIKGYGRFKPPVLHFLLNASKT